jgi:hypothetical protein
MARVTGNSSDADPPTEHKMPTETLTETIRRELPALLRQDPELRRFILDLTRGLYADRAQTEDRFDRLLDELRRDREEQTRKWEENNRKWEENNRKWEENNREQNRKWEESRQEFAAVHEEIMAQARKFDRSIGALGARWGLQSEAAFRNALAGILEQSFGVTVRNVCEFGDTGEVFGRPDQVELDIIIKNGLLLILELKSSIDKAGIYSFERKARFYERRHQRKADRLIVVSPMIEPKALAVARDLGIETYSDSLEVPNP